VDEVGHTDTIMIVYWQIRHCWSRSVAPFNKCFQARVSATTSHVGFSSPRGTTFRHYLLSRLELRWV